MYPYGLCLSERTVRMIHWEISDKDSIDSPTHGYWNYKEKNNIPNHKWDLYNTSIVSQLSQNKYRLNQQTCCDNFVRYNPWLTNFEFLSECLNTCWWIRSHWEQTDHRCPVCALTPHYLQVQDHSLGILLSQRVGDVLACLCERTIGAPASDQEQAAEHIKGIVVTIRNNLLFRLLLIKPVLPLLLVTGNLGEQKCRFSICSTDKNTGISFSKL